jgi:hypothetical protein
VYCYNKGEKMLHKLMKLALVLVIGGLLAVGIQAQESIDFGQQAEGSINQATPQIVYTFAGELGQSIIISMDSEDFDSYLELADADGNEITFDDDGGGYPDAQIGPLLLTDSGEYQIIAKSIDSSAKGDFVLELSNIKVAVLNYDEPLDTELTAETEVLYFRFDGKAGSVINLSVDSGGELDTRVAIRDTANSEVARDDDSGKGNDPLISNFIVPQDDVYIAAIEPYSVGLTGELQVTLWQSELSSLDDGSQTIMMTDEAYRQALTFAGNAGEQVQITIQFADDAAEFLTVYLRQGGEDITYINGNGLENLSFGVTTPVGGQVFLIMESMFFMDESLSAEVSLERLPTTAK